MILLAYGLVALAPFRWEPPQRHANGAIADAKGVRFPSAGVAYTPQPPDWLGAVTAHQRLRVELRLRTYASPQSGPARILTISRDVHRADLTIGQDGSDLVLFLRRPGSTPNGKPPYRVQQLFGDDGHWHDVAIAIGPAHLRLVVDGAVAFDAPLPARPFDGWHRRHRLALGNELNGLRPWHGEIARAVVDAGGDRTDYARPGALQVPETFWSFANTPRWLGPEEIDGHAVRDWAANFGSFVLLGFLLGALGGPRGSWRRAVIVAALASLVVEIAQGFVSRHPDSMDWALNTLGAAFGAAIARARGGPPGCAADQSPDALAGPEPLETAERDADLAPR